MKPLVTIENIWYQPPQGTSKNSVKAHWCSAQHKSPHLALMRLKACSLTSIEQWRGPAITRSFKSFHQGPSARSTGSDKEAISPNA
ncbi:hypothetical protein DUNSADRAFT_17 [Dunaliella salina]|uniref:Encoded protein n=1 Tax=Dunaliella salina TaxID=3046 RepID=A0ABQ7HAL3_DUNSA|nr:hypothetical protein DUNSADRAFT_17 [Dunaliella salina]|eukprot:KAF5843895.1 hypothetical protein DUNSADRAFT_17 [Dunaliella salina]